MILNNTALSKYYDQIVKSMYCVLFDKDDGFFYMLLFTPDKS